MATVLQHKFVGALPPVLVKDSVYYVRVGAGVDIYVTNGSGTIVAYPGNYATLAQVGDIAAALDAINGVGA